MRLTVICVVILGLSCSANANLDIGAGLAQKAALVGGVFNAAQKQIGAKLHEGFNHVAITLGSGVSAAQAVQGAATNAAHMGLGFAQRKANQTAGVALGLAQLGVGAAQTAHSSVLGNIYDAADAFLKKPTVAAPANLTEDADGYCFPEFKGPDFGLPRPSCAQGYHMTPIGKCVQKTYRKIDVCFNGPKCMAPFNETGTPSCFDDKVMQVITGLLAMKKSGIALPLSIAPALAEFGQASANVPVTLAKESLELHLGLAAKALGVGKSALGLSDGGDLIGMGSKLMTVDWPALPDFNKLYDTVSKAVHQVPSKALDEAKKVAPKCIRKCCKQDVQIDTAFAAPTWGCAAGKKMDTIGFKCVGDKLGYAKCPAGLTSCFLASWHRPLCAVKAENCKSLEIMAALHKLKNLFTKQRRQQQQTLNQQQTPWCAAAAASDNGGGDGSRAAADSSLDDGSVSASKLRFNKDVPLTHHNPESPDHLSAGELPDHLKDLQLGDDGLLIDGKTGRVVNGLGATRFDVKLAALRGDLDPKPWEENTERAPGVLLGSLVTFPADYTFQVVGASAGGCSSGEHAEFVDDMVATVARLTETPLPLADGAVKRKQRLGGKYVSLSVTVNVRAPELVTRVYEELGKDTRVKMKF